MQEPLHLQLERVPSPLGEMLIATDPAGRLRILDWKDHEDDMRRLLRLQYRGRSVQLHESDTVSHATQAMQAYFSGDLTALDDIKVATGGTDFQREVWAVLAGRSATWNWPCASGDPRRSAPLGWRMARIRLVWWCPAIV